MGLWCLPFYSFLEGCGHVRAVAAMRLRQSAASALGAWALLLMRHGLYAPAAMIVAQIAVGLLFLAGHRQLLAGLLRHRPGGIAIEWKREVWPFQWRIAVSWMCSYFTVQALIPILFALRGSVEAGQMGMSLSITGYMTGLVLPWISTKATPFGRMIANGQFRSLDRIFRRTFAQAMAVFGFIALGVCAGAVLLPLISPHLAARMVPPQLFVALVIAAGANCAVQCFAILLRSFKREPFLVQSLMAAAAHSASRGSHCAAVGRCRRGVQLSGGCGGLRPAFGRKHLRPRPPQISRHSSGSGICRRKLRGF